MRFSRNATALALAALTSIATAQSSCSLSPSSGIRPSIASGYRMQVVATGLAKPRGLALDTDGKLLVVQAGSGIISAHTLQENNGCVTVESSSNVTTSLGLNHGIEMSLDGKTLYSSTSGDAYAWDYDASGASVSNQRTLVTNMTGSDHSTRTLLLSRAVDGYLMISKGSNANLDLHASSVDTGFAQVKAFNILNLTAESDPYDYQAGGMLLAWGVRNEVGIAEHPSGDIYGVENSADQQRRLGVDIHANNPGEELNYFGRLDGTASANQGSNFGYPWCFSAWDVDALPDNGNFTVGDQYAIDSNSALDNQNRTDQYCAEQTRATLVFQAHMAPLDIKFNNTGKEAWITFHGSWNREEPIGYKLSLVAFNEDGTPVEDRTSRTAAVDILANEDLSRCPDNCFRPAAMVIDNQGRIFMSSDATGEIYLIERDEVSTGTNGSSPTASITTGGGAAAATSSGSAANNIQSPFTDGPTGSISPMLLLAVGILAGFGIML